MRPTFAASAGNARGPVILGLLAVSIAVGVWTYWQDILQLLSPGPKIVQVAPPAPPGGTQFAPNPQLRVRGAVAGIGPRDGKVIAAPVAAPPAVVVEEPAPEEPEGNLPEKLSPIRITEGEEMKRMERQIMARKQLDEPAAIQEYLRAARIDGVRVAGPMSKLIFNGQIYQVGDTVSEQPRVTIRKITQAQVVFQDPKGNEYPVKY